jgi:ferredoxin like protein
MSIDEKLRVNAYLVHPRPHIQVDFNKCRKCPEKPCTKLCPAGCFRMLPDGSISFSHDACLECGTCRIVCRLGAVTWDYPEAGFGIWYRFG